MTRILADSNEGGHLFQSDRGHHSNLMAASLESSRGPVLVMSWQRSRGQVVARGLGQVRCLIRPPPACVGSSRSVRCGGSCAPADRGWRRRRAPGLLRGSGNRSCSSVLVKSHLCRRQLDAEPAGSDWRTRADVQVFGSAPRLLIPDNLKSGVNKSSFYDPEINRSYGKMAAHYNVGVVPARPRKPKDKAKVDMSNPTGRCWCARYSTLEIVRDQQTRRRTKDRNTRTCAPIQSGRLCVQLAFGIGEI
jgi:hypothetical protein